MWRSRRKSATPAVIRDALRLCRLGLAASSRGCRVEGRSAFGCRSVSHVSLPVPSTLATLHGYLHRMVPETHPSAVQQCSSVRRHDQRREILCVHAKGSRGFSHTLLASLEDIRATLAGRTWVGSPGMHWNVWKQRLCFAQKDRNDK